MITTVAKNVKESRECPLYWKVLAEASLKTEDKLKNQLSDEKRGVLLDRKEPDGRSERNRHRRAQGEVRGQVLNLLIEGFSPQEICSQLGISQNTFYYHVRGLRAQGHIFPGLAARRGRPLKTENQFLDQWLAIKEQARDARMIRFLKLILEEARHQQVAEFEVRCNPLPHQSAYLEQHPKLSSYDWVTAVGFEDLRLLQGLLNEMGGNLDKNENFRELLLKILGSQDSKAFLEILNALKVFDLTNLRENIRRASKKA